MEKANERLHAKMQALEETMQTKSAEIVKLEMENTLLDNDVRVQQSTLDSIKKSYDSTLEDLIIARTDIENYEHELQLLKGAGSSKEERGSVINLSPSNNVLQEIADDSFSTQRAEVSVKKSFSSSALSHAMTPKHVMYQSFREFPRRRYYCTFVGDYNKS